MGMDGPASNLSLVTHEEFPFIQTMQAPVHLRKETSNEPLGAITTYLCEGYVPYSITPPLGEQAGDRSPY
jgi:hypothetical protein